MSGPTRPLWSSWVAALVVLAVAAVGANDETGNNANKAHDYMLQLTGSHTTLSSSSGSSKSDEEDFAKTTVRAKRLVLQVPNGHDLRLTCKLATRDADNYVLNWYLPRYIDSDRVKKLKSDGLYSITVANITDADAGHFKCTATRVSNGKKRKKQQPDGEVLVYENDDYAEDGTEDDEYAEGDYGELVMRDHGNRYDLEKRVTVWVVSQSNAYLFPCPGTTYGIFQRFVCDGVADCPDGHDEDVARCGDDPCRGKLTCHNGRCLDPSTCCDPEVDPTCTHVPACCLPIVNANRHMNVRLGLERSMNERVEHSIVANNYNIIIYTVLGCILTICAVVLVVLFFFCRSQARAERRRRLRERLRLAHLPHDVVSDIDVAFLALSTRLPHTRACSNEYVRCPRQIVVGGRRATPLSVAVANGSPPPPYRDSDLNAPPPAYASSDYSDDMVYIDMSEYMRPRADTATDEEAAEVGGVATAIGNSSDLRNLPQEAFIDSIRNQSISTDQSSSTVLDMARSPCREEDPRAAQTSAEDEADPLLSPANQNGCDRDKQGQTSHSREVH